MSGPVSEADVAPVEDAAAAEDAVVEVLERRTADVAGTLFGYDQGVIGGACRASTRSSTSATA